MLNFKNAANRLTFMNHRGICPPSPAKEGEMIVEKRYVYTANMKLAQYGYTMSQKLLEEFCKTTQTEFLNAFSDLFDMLSHDAKVISLTSPIWPNFPDDAMDADLVELYIVNLFNYLTHGEWQPEFDPTKICKGLSKETLPALKQIPLCDEKEAYRYVMQCLTNHTPLSRDQLSEIDIFLAAGGEEGKNCLMAIMKDKHIACKENLATYTAYILDAPNWKEQACIKDFQSSTDVLRLAAAMSGQDVSLASSPKFRSFKRSERRTLLNLMELSDAAEGFALRPEEFKRLGEKLHPREYEKLFPKTAALFSKIRNGERLETYNSKLQELMVKPVNVEALSAHLMLRPGMFARNLDFALRNCQSEQQIDNVLFRFISVCKSVEPRVLIQLINHFRSRNNDVQIATGKANGAASMILSRDVNAISKDVCNRVARDIFNQLWQVLRAEDAEPKNVYIDPECHANKLVFPDNPRQITSAMRATACGSRTSLPDGNVIRAFLYWKNKKDSDGYNEWDNVDFDLSVAFFGDGELKANSSDFLLNYVENKYNMSYLSYAKPKDEKLGAIHSGDRRCSGPNGAVEYVDFDIRKCLANGYRYAAMVVNSFSGEKFSEMESAFCGVMVRDGETGEQFEPSTIKDRFALTTDAIQLTAVVIDLYKREVVTVDKTVKENHSAYNDVLSDYLQIIKLCEYAMQLRNLSIKEMLGMRFAKFCKESEWHEADVIVSEFPDKFIPKSEGDKIPPIVNPFDVPGIYNVILGNEAHQ